MTQRTLHGLTFDVVSPSFYTLSGYPVDVSFLGNRWFLFCPMPDGEIKTREFVSLDNAAKYLAEAVFA